MSSNADTQTFLTAIKAGASNDVAGAHAGMTVAEVRQLLQTDTELAAEVAEARAGIELFAIGSVRRTMAEDANAAMWLAEKVRGDSELERLRALTT